MSTLLAAALLLPFAQEPLKPQEPQVEDVQFEVIALEYAEAKETLVLLEALVPEAKVMLDPRTNSLLLAADTPGMVQLKQAIVGFDRQVAAGPAAGDDAFPAPSEDMVIAVGDGGASWTVMDLVSDYTRLTNQHIQADAGTRNFLESTPTGLTRSVVVPKGQVQSFFEGLLAQNSFVLTVINPTEPRLLGITSLQTGQRGALRSQAFFVPAEAIAGWADNPASLVTTVVHMRNTDVRQLSNSMRVLLTDQNTQTMMAAGNTNSMIITGMGTQVAYIVEMMRQVDAAAAEQVHQPQFRRFPLKHASAPEVAPLIEDLVGASHGTQGPGMVQGVQPSSRQARIVPDARTNSLMVMCLPADLQNITDLVALFDVKQD